MARFSGASGARQGSRRLSGSAQVMFMGLLMLLLTAYAARYVATPAESGAWSRFGFDPASSRTNSTEMRLNPSNVHELQRLWTATLPDVADSSPAYLPAIRFPDGTTRDVLYLTTKSGRIVALDADTGGELWAHSHSHPTAGPNMVTTSSPLVDPTSGDVYAYSMDGKIHKYDAISGTEIFANGWPKTITTLPQTEKESSALNAANGYLYATIASCCGDATPYQGHVVAIDLTSGAKHVFNAVCSNLTHVLAPGECPESGAGIWARPGVVVDPITGNIFVTTGNGPYTGDHGGHDWGESVLELTPDATRLVDSYTPENPDALGPQDLDLGSAAPALLPAIPASNTPYLAVQASKEAELRLLNRRNLSRQGSPGHTGGALQTLDAPDHCPILTQPAVWTDPQSGAIWVFVSNYCATAGYQVVTSRAGITTLRQVWTTPEGASSPVVAANVLFEASTDPNDKAVLALDPRSGRQLWNSTTPTAGGSIDTIHWESPIVIGGRVYCTDEAGQVTAYALP
jgi:outer membrane protein assembly factor BamB